jgi:N-methylhydantoinase A/oxoprolinase/acetone carboxylase beta subunit
MDSTIYDRSKMQIGCTIEGPAMIEEYAASTPIPPKHQAAIDEYRNIVITRI